MIYWSNDLICLLKGKLGDFFYWLKFFIGPKQKQVSKGNFHRKASKWVKNQTKGSKIHKIRTKWYPTNSVLGATVGIHFLQIRPPTYCGIHQFCPPSYCGNPLFKNSATNLLWESIKSVVRAAVGIHCIFNTPSLLQCQMLL